MSSKGYGAIGVADGVGGWAEDGVDPALYPKKLMESCSQIFGRTSNSQAPSTLEVLMDAYGKVCSYWSHLALLNSAIFYLLSCSRFRV